jgi:hypothetical protein
MPTSRVQSVSGPTSEPNQPIVREMSAEKGAPDPPDGYQRYRLDVDPSISKSQGCRPPGGTLAYPPAEGKIWYSAPAG